MAWLRFGSLGAHFSWYQDLTAIVQGAVDHVGVVQKVRLPCRLAGGDLRDFRFVVRAASAFAALGVPPFRICWILNIRDVPLDPGRTRLKEDQNAREQRFVALGHQLAKRLIFLHESTE